MPVAYSGAVVTLQDEADADGNGTAMDVSGAARVTVQASGTFTATINFEGSLDGTTWFAVGLKTAADGNAVTTASAAGVWKRTPDLALTALRARISSYSDGDVTVVALKEY
jgi:hypothetical protein